MNHFKSKGKEKKNYFCDLDCCRNKLQGQDFLLSKRNQTCSKININLLNTRDYWKTTKNSLQTRMWRSSNCPHNSTSSNLKLVILSQNEFKNIIWLNCRRKVNYGEKSIINCSRRIFPISNPWPSLRIKLINLCKSCTRNSYRGISYWIK